MKATITKSLKELIHDRYLFVLIIVFLFIAIIYMTAIGISIRPSERQIVTHYSAFGTTFFYFNQWFYLVSFVLFGLAVSAINTIVTIKLLLVKGHSLAVTFAWISIGIIILSWSTASTVLVLGKFY